MNTFYSKYKKEEPVTLTIAGTIIRGCSISAIKFAENDTELFDIELPGGGKLYDIKSEWIKSLTEEGNQITKSEIS